MQRCKGINSGNLRQAPPRQCWILNSTPWIPDSSHWIPNSLSVELGFRIPWATFQIPKPRIPDSISKLSLILDSTSRNFPDYRIQIPYSLTSRFQPEGCPAILWTPIFGRNTWKIHLISETFMRRHAFWTDSFQCLARSLLYMRWVYHKDLTCMTKQLLFI